MTGQRLTEESKHGQFNREPARREPSGKGTAIMSG